MSFSYSGLSNYGKATLPSVEGGFGSMNVLRDPPKSISTRRKIRVGEKEVNIAFATDSLVHPEFRRPISNFFSIMKEIKNVHDFSLVLHTSNENTEALYHDVLKFRCPISLSSYGVPINLITTLKKVLGFDSVIFNFIKH